MNNELNQFAKSNTHFNRTDQWKNASFENKESLLFADYICAAAVVVAIVSLLIIATF